MSAIRDSLSLVPKVMGDTVMVNDANVVKADVAASNGVIHVIAKVLMPPMKKQTL